MKEEFKNVEHAIQVLLTDTKFRLAHQVIKTFRLTSMYKSSLKYILGGEIVLQIHYDLSSGMSSADF